VPADFLSCPGRGLGSDGGGGGDAALVATETWDDGGGGGGGSGACSIAARLHLLDRSTATLHAVESYPNAMVYDGIQHNQEICSVILQPMLYQYQVVSGKSQR
jgi:hypothetical protein